MIHVKLQEHAGRAPKKIAVVQGSRNVSYRELDAAVDRVANYLVRNGIRKGDRIAILSENSPEYIASYLGVQKAGGVAVDVNYQFSCREVQKILSHSQARVLIAERKHLEKIASCVDDSATLMLIIGIDRRVKRTPAPPVFGTASCRYVSYDTIMEGEPIDVLLPKIASGEVCSIIYTSGTTGEPKGVMLTHGNFAANAESIISYLALTEKDSVMVVLPFCYSYGKSLMTTHLTAGGTVVLENSFMYPNVILKKMMDEEVTGFAGVPSTYAILLNRSNIRSCSFPKLRYITQAGGAMSPLHAQELSQIVGDGKLFIMYGQTEATARLTYLDPSELNRKPGSIGRAIPGVSIELMKPGDVPAKPGEEGEIAASGGNVMAGYWNNSAETARVLKSGRLYTGDIATKDDEGYLYIVGRRSDMIKSGAHRISPKEIEEVLLEVQEVHEAAVVGAPDDILGEVIRAFIVLKEGMTIDAKSVHLHCQARLASFKIPRDIVFVAELPKTTSGKVKRHELKHVVPALQGDIPGRDIYSEP